MVGQIHTNGGSWMLEGCGPGCFLWIKQTNDWVDEISSPDSTPKEELFERDSNTLKLLVKLRRNTYV